MKELNEDYRFQLREKLMGKSFAKKTVSDSVVEKVVARRMEEKKNPLDLWDRPVKSDILESPYDYKWNDRAGNKKTVVNEETETKTSAETLVEKVESVVEQETPALKKYKVI